MKLESMKASQLKRFSDDEALAKRDCLAAITGTGEDVIPKLSRWREAFKKMLTYVEDESSLRALKKDLDELKLNPTFSTDAGHFVTKIERKIATLPKTKPVLTA